MIRRAAPAHILVAWSVALGAASQACRNKPEPPLASAPGDSVASAAATIDGETPASATESASGCDDAPGLQRQCTARDAVSCARLGYCFAHGESVPQEDAKATDLYAMACDQGVTGACGNLGFMYAAGRGVQRDEKKAYELYAKACAGGSLGDCTNQGSALQLGQGVPKDLARARDIYSRTCREGDGAGCTGLGILRLEGTPDAADEQAAVGFFRAGCEHDDALGCANLGVKLRASGHAREAEGLFAKACRLGDSSSCPRSP